MEHGIDTRIVLPQGAEKRVHPRHPLSMPIQVRLEDTSEVRSSTLCDISSGGLSFLFTQFLAKGAHLGLTVPVSGRLFRVRAEVIYSNRIPSMNLYRTGVRYREGEAEFKRCLQEQFEELAAFRQSLSAEAGKPVAEDEAERIWCEKFARRFGGLF